MKAHYYWQFIIFDNLLNILDITESFKLQSQSKKNMTFSIIHYLTSSISPSPEQNIHAWNMDKVQKKIMNKLAEKQRQWRSHERGRKCEEKQKKKKKKKKREREERKQLRPSNVSGAAGKMDSYELHLIDADRCQWFTARRRLRIVSPFPAPTTFTFSSSLPSTSERISMSHSIWIYLNFSNFIWYYYLPELKVTLRGNRQLIYLHFDKWKLKVVVSIIVLSLPHITISLWHPLQ